MGYAMILTKLLTLWPVENGLSTKVTFDKPTLGQSHIDRDCNVSNENLMGKFLQRLWQV